ncbi:MYXO-CTERM sorting domain-containing protein [Micromonospora sp. R77]
MRPASPTPPASTGGSCSCRSSSPPSPWPWWPVWVAAGASRTTDAP